jgi:hypothetical protein
MDQRPGYGQEQVVPLLGKAWEVLQRQPRSGDRVFPFNDKSAGARFTLAKKALKISGLWLDDIRRDADLRLLDDGVPFEEVLKLAGPKNLERLLRYRESIRRK